MNLLRRGNSAPGYHSLVDDPKLCSFIRFGVLNLDEGEAFQDSTTQEEACLVILSGVCSVAVGDERWDDVGGRRNVFDGAPYSVYVPRDTSLEVSAKTDCAVAVCRTRVKNARPPRLITPDQIRCRTVGQWNWKRRVCDIMGNESEIPERLIVGETYNPPGNWSSAPPHKHDVDDLPRESKLEEVYYYKLKPSQGFGLQRVYTADGDLDESYVVRDGDAVAIPKGYHPVVAAPGYSLYYLWVLAGEKRIMRPNDDPSHAWLKNCEDILSQVS